MNHIYNDQKLGKGDKNDKNLYKLKVPRYIYIPEINLKNKREGKFGANPLRNVAVKSKAPQLTNIFFLPYVSAKYPHEGPPTKYGDKHTSNNIHMHIIANKLR